MSTTYSKLCLGYRDDARGVFVQTKGVIKMASLGFAYQSANSRFIAYVSGMVQESGRNTDAKCNEYTSDNTAGDKTFFHTGGNVYLYDSAYTDDASLKAHLTETGDVLIYPLATPVETDISDILEDCGVEVNSTYGQVCRGGEGGGTIVITTNTGLAVPSDDTFLIKTV